MTDDPIETKSPPKNRITVIPEMKERIDSWRHQLEDKHPGIRISDGELINWLISKSPAILSAKQVAEIKEAFFDEIKQLEWQLARAKMERQTGASTG